LAIGDRDLPIAYRLGPMRDCDEPIGRRLEPIRRRQRPIRAQHRAWRRRQMANGGRVGVIAGSDDAERRPVVSRGRRAEGMAG
jgi:hypothetical protein